VAALSCLVRSAQHALGGTDGGWSASGLELNASRSFSHLTAQCNEVACSASFGGRIVPDGLRCVRTYVPLRHPDVEETTVAERMPVPTSPPTHRMPRHNLAIAGF
jgi:hypothetical protein